jgi:hypothetical protein
MPRVARMLGTIVLQQSVIGAMLVTTANAHPAHIFYAS